MPIMCRALQCFAGCSEAEISELPEDVQEAYADFTAAAEGMDCSAPPSDNRGSL